MALSACWMAGHSWTSPRERSPMKGSIIVPLDAGRLQEVSVPYDFRLFIGGAWRSGEQGAGIALIDPATAKPIGQVARASRRDIGDALAAAAASAAGWRATAARARGDILIRAARLLEKRIGAAARALSAEQGKTIDEATGEIARVVETQLWNGEQAERLCAPFAVGGRRMLAP